MYVWLLRTLETESLRALSLENTIVIHSHPNASLHLLFTSSAQCFLNLNKLIAFLIINFFSNNIQTYISFFFKESTSPFIIKIKKYKAGSNFLIHTTNTFFGLSFLFHTLISQMIKLEPRDLKCLKPVYKSEQIYFKRQTQVESMKTHSV